MLQLFIFSRVKIEIIRLVISKKKSRCFILAMYEFVNFMNFKLVLFTLY